MKPPLADPRDNLYVPADLNIKNDFEQLYISLRRREQRIYTDKELFQLPDIAAGHPHFKEWLIRKQSCMELISHLELKKSILHILEIGCGNGWLSYELSRIPGSMVVGIDINLTELQQAARVFSNHSKLRFVCGDIRSAVLKDLKFNTIVFAASIQYFPDLQEILAVAFNQLYSGGEIHIIDSRFYKPAEVDAAAKRTIAYYLSLGFPEMANHYFHHCMTGLGGFSYKFLRNPDSLKLRLFGNKNPFYWICIKKDPF